MTSAQQLIYDTVGRPPIEGAKGKLLKPEPGVCSITGEPQEITADAPRALGENFTDHSLWRATLGVSDRPPCGAAQVRVLCRRACGPGYAPPGWTCPIR